MPLISDKEIQSKTNGKFGVGVGSHLLQLRTLQVEGICHLSHCVHDL
jgi:hypothetical protein